MVESTLVRQVPVKSVRFDTEVYKVIDYTLGDAVLSQTILYPGKNTRGHSHLNEEIYYVASGEGQMHLGNSLRVLEVGSFIVIGSNVFHRVINTSKVSNLVFLCSWSK